MARFRHGPPLALRLQPKNVLTLDGVAPRQSRYLDHLQLALPTSSTRAHGGFSALHKHVVYESSTSSKRAHTDSLGGDFHQDGGRKKRKTEGGIVPDEQAVFSRYWSMITIVWVYCLHISPSRTVGRNRSFQTIVLWLATIFSLIVCRTTA